MTPPTTYPASTAPRPPWEKPPTGLPVYGVVAKQESLSAVRDRGIVVSRSGQPTQEGFQYLHTQGVRTFVSLREPNDGSPDDSEATCRDLGIVFHRLPWRDEKAPLYAIASEWLYIARDPASWPLHVACLAGRGRTSVACALLRFTFDAWAMEQAREEILLYRPDFKLFRWPLARPQKRFLEQWSRIHLPSYWSAP